MSQTEDIPEHLPLAIDRGTLSALWDLGVGALWVGSA